MRKGGQMAEGINMMYRLFMVSVVAFIVFSAGSLSYNYYIDARDVEARIMARDVVECLAGDGVLNLDGIRKDDRDAIVGYCGFPPSDRFYVGVEVLDSSGSVIEKMKEGDSGMLWIGDLFGRVRDFSGNVIAGKVVKGLDDMVQYEPGYYFANYSVFVVNEGKREEGKIGVEVLVNYEK